MPSVRDRSRRLRRRVLDSSVRAGGRSVVVAVPFGREFITGARENRTGFLAMRKACAAPELAVWPRTKLHLEQTVAWRGRRRHDRDRLDSKRDRLETSATDADSISVV